MYFRLGYTVRKFILNKKNQPIKFSYGGPHDIEIILRLPNEEEQKVGHKTENAFCDSYCKVNPSIKIQKYFDLLEQNKFPDLNNIDEDIAHHIDENGFMKHMLPLQYFPDSFQSFARQINKELSEFSKNTINAFRWRFAKWGPHNPISSRGMAWSPDKKTWHPVPPSTQIIFDSFAEPPLTSNAVEEIINFVNDGLTEPLGHQLYREAKEQINENPRSSVLMAISAVEVGIKDCISSIIPGAEWLVGNVPSPPIIRILSEYIPNLPCQHKINGKVLPPPKQLLDVLKKGVTIRNDITHRGNPPPKHETIKEILSAVKDTLWLLDFYSGQAWAYEYITPEMRKRLES